MLVRFYINMFEFLHKFSVNSKQDSDKKKKREVIKNVKHQMRA